MNYAAVAHAAGVSRTWLYRQDQIRDLISQLRDQPPAAARTAQRASTDSLRQRLDTARAEITRLRAENRSLRDQLARQLGLQRTHGQQSARRAVMTPARPLPADCGEDMSTPQKHPSTRHDTQTTPDNRRSALPTGVADPWHADLGDRYSQERCRRPLPRRACRAWHRRPAQPDIGAKVQVDMGTRTPPSAVLLTTAARSLARRPLKNSGSRGTACRSPGHA